MNGKKLGLALMAGLVVLLLAAGSAVAQEEIDPEQQQMDEAKMLVAIGCAIAVGVAGIASALGTGIAGISCAGVVAEKPDKFSKALALQAMPQTQLIYGVLVCIFMLMGMGMLGGEPKAGINFTTIGIASIGIGLTMGLTGISAIPQGMTAGAGAAAVAKNEEAFSKSLIFTVMSETPALFGLVICVMVMRGVGLM